MMDDVLNQAREILKTFVQADSDKKAMGGMWVGSPEGAAVERIHDAEAFYSELAQERDYSTSLYLLPFPGGEMYVMMMIPDGNDGWFEAYTTTGELVGAGQFVREKVAFADVATVRAAATSTDMETAFLPEFRSTLVWEALPDGGCQSTCGRFHIHPSGSQWVIDEIPDRCDTLEEAQALAQMLSAIF